MVEFSGSDCFTLTQMESGTRHQEIIARLRPYVERAKRLKGFQLEVEPIRLGPPPPWNYEARARELLAGARSVLDIGTGGGEVFSEILEAHEVFAVATEPWPPNVPIAAQRLRPFGAHVVQANSLALPFASKTFDLVLNRHEELDPAEVARVLAPGGHVLTQQVHPDNWKELRAFFPRMSDFGPHFQLYQNGLREGGLVIRHAEMHETLAAFRNLGEIAYMLTALPWEVPDFDVERDIEALVAMEKALRHPEGIVLTDGRYIIEAYKPDRRARKTRPARRNVRFDVNYLSDASTPALALCLKTTAQVGACSLRIFGLVIPERFTILGLSNELDARQSGSLKHASSLVCQAPRGEGILL